MKELTVSADTSSSFWEFLNYKQLTYFIVKRDFKVKYKQATLGILWTVLQPLLFAGVMSFILFQRGDFSFGYNNVSSLVVVLLGFSLFQFFESSLTTSSSSLLQNQALIKKIYFPKIILLISAVFNKFIDFFISISVFIVFLIITGSSFNYLGFLFLIPCVAFLAITSLAVALTLAPLNVRFQDIQLLLPFINRIMFFTTPIWYPFNILPGIMQDMLLFNPVVGVVETMKAAFFDTGNIDLKFILYPLITTCLFLIIGVHVFKKRVGGVANYV